MPRVNCSHPISSCIHRQRKKSASLWNPWSVYLCPAENSQWTICRFKVFTMVILQSRNVSLQFRKLWRSSFVVIVVKLSFVCQCLHHFTSQENHHHLCHHGLNHQQLNPHLWVRDKRAIVPSSSSLGQHHCFEWHSGFSLERLSTMLNLSSSKALS